jgi:hypothetical protein
LPRDPDSLSLIHEDEDYSAASASFPTNSFLHEKAPLRSFNFLRKTRLAK